MEPFEEFEHGAIFVVEESLGDVNVVVGRYADEILVKRTVMDGAETEPIGDNRLAPQLEIANDVCGVEQTRLLQPAYRTQARIRNEHVPAEPSLM